MMDWNLIVAIITALGLFEIVKKVLSFALENNLIKRNLEVREIAGRVMQWSSWLKIRNFDQPLPPKIIEQLYYDIFKIEPIDNKLSQDMMRLINLPKIISSLRDNQSRQPENAETINDYTNRLHDLTNKLNQKCNKLRYYPILDFNKVVKYMERKLRLNH